MFERLMGIRKRKIDIIKSLRYSKKWLSKSGHFIVAKRTYIQAGKKNIVRLGNVRIGIPKGIFGYIGIPGNDATLIKVDNQGKLHLEEDVLIYAGCRVIVADNATVKIGARTSVAANTYIFARKEISIGADCAISWDCQIMDTDFHQLEDLEAKYEKDASVTIGNHVLICSKVSILKGVTIGDNVIIGANSVVTKDIPSDCLVVGNPAQIIKSNIKWN